MPGWPYNTIFTIQWISQIQIIEYNRIIWNPESNRHSVEWCRLQAPRLRPDFFFRSLQLRIAAAFSRWSFPLKRFMAKPTCFFLNASASEQTKRPFKACWSDLFNGTANAWAEAYPNKLVANLLQCTILVSIIHNLMYSIYSILSKLFVSCVTTKRFDLDLLWSMVRLPLLGAHRKASVSKVHTSNCSTCLSQ